jgi:hypothetical protein
MALEPELPKAKEEARVIRELATPLWKRMQAIVAQPPEPLSPTLQFNSQK